MGGGCTDSSDLLEQRGQLVSGDLAVTKDFRNQPGPDRFSGMDRNNGSPAVLVSQEVMAASDPNDLETSPLQRLDEVTPRKARHSAHAATVIF